MRVLNRSLAAAVGIRSLVATIGVGVILVATACATPQGPAAGGDEWPAAGGDEWPAGRDFLATSITENGEPKAIVEGTTILVSFEATGAIGAYAGCNYWNGSGRVESGTLIVDEISRTQRGCASERMEQDRLVWDLLTSDPTLRLSGDELTLSTATITMVMLDREVADPDRPLAGTAWTVISVYDYDGGASSISYPVPAVLTIDAATGSFTSTTGCAGGELKGTATVAGSSITFVVSEEKPCIGGSNRVDEAVRATLTGELSYEIEADHLRLLRPSGDGLGLATGTARGVVEVDCGTAILAQGATPPDSMLTCFIDAVAAGRSAHLTIVRPTVEGDPVPTSYRYYGEGPSIQVMIDYRQDSFGPQEFLGQDCAQPRVEEGFLAFATCSDTWRIE